MFKYLEATKSGMLEEHKRGTFKRISTQFEHDTSFLVVMRSIAL